MTETKKKIPNAITVMLVLLGYAFGSMIGGFLIITGFIFDRMVVLTAIWVMFTFVSLIVFEIMAWKHRGLLVEWGLSNQKRKRRKRNNETN